MNATNMRTGLAKAIHQLRNEIGMSQRDLADKLGCTRQNIVHWEVGTSTPTVAGLPDVAKALDVRTVELVRLACQLGNVR